MSVEIRLLGGFEVVVDGETVASGSWQRRAAADLVKLLALTDGHRLHRERVLESLWPGVDVASASPRLHKAAHYARRAVGRADAVVVRGETVALLPDDEIVVDVAVFDDLASAADERGDLESAERALAAYGGDLLPDDLYEPWAADERDRLARLRTNLLRQARRWNDLLAVDPADEAAHLALMKEHLARGDRMAALRQFERLDRVLRQDLGVAPSRAAIALRDRALAAAPARAPAGTPVGGTADEVDEDDDLVGRERELAALTQLFERAPASGRAAFLSGPPGSGKTVLLERALSTAGRRGWRTGRGSASRIDGAWPYAPVLEAIADLCRQHPALLDGLADEHRTEIERVLVLREAADPSAGGHQRLFVATTELLRLAAAGEGALLVVDDAHDCDEASLRLLHHLVRSSVDTRVVVLLAHRPGLATPLSDVRASLLERRSAVEIDLPPLSAEEVRDLVERHVRAPSRELLASIAELSAGQPFAVAELAKRAADAPGDVRPLMTVLVERLPAPLRDVLAHVAVAGTGFDTDEFVALSGLDESTAYDRLDEALAVRAVLRDASGYRFRHPLLREALLEQVAAHRRRQLHRDAAQRLEALGASPARVAHHLVAAADLTAAAPHLLTAARAEAAVGAYQDALALLDAFGEHPPAGLAGEVQVLRGDMLTRLGDRRAVDAYRGALPHVTGPLRRQARIGLSRAAMESGDLETANAALEGLEPEGGPGDGALLLARANLAFWSGDVDTAAQVTAQARALLALAHDSWELLDLVALQGLIAHQRGEWYSRLEAELRSTSEGPRVVTGVFDANLCVAEYLLYGPTPYSEVRKLAEQIRRSAERAGSLRGVAFAHALAGEAALLSGDLDAAEEELERAVDLHADADARAGQALSLQRLAEVHLARGDRDTARRLLDRAVPLARWTSLAQHLIDRIYGTMIAAAPDPAAARAVVDAAQLATDEDRDRCQFCAVTFAVPATIACADVGDVEAARRHLADAEHSTAVWPGTAWQAATTEARAHVVAAAGDRQTAHRLLEEAGRMFAQAGQPRDAERCARAAGETAAETGAVATAL